MKGKHKWLGLAGAWCVFLVLACAGDDDGGNAEAQAGNQAGNQAAGSGDSGADTQAMRLVLAQWAERYIAAFDRTVAASCACLVSSSAFASLEDCMLALGSSPEWLECSLSAFDEADGGFVIDPTQAECLVSQSNARGECLEQAGCDYEAMSACLDGVGLQPDSGPACGNLASDLVVYLLEKCPDLGLLSR